MQPTHIANPVQVNAAEILEVSNVGAHDTMLRLSDGRNFVAGPEMIARYFPQSRDYLVTQEDGYEYINPKDVFERKYSPIGAQVQGAATTAEQVSADVAPAPAAKPKATKAKGTAAADEKAADVAPAPSAAQQDQPA